MHLALATCTNVPHWESDDKPFHQELASRGIQVTRPPWDDPDVDWAEFDACLIRTTWDYMDKQDDYVAWARHAAGKTQFFNPPQVIAWNTDKRYLRDLENAGVPIAPSLWFEQGDKVDLAALLAEQPWERGFLKPVIGATARETLRFATDPEGIAQAQAHLDRVLATEAMILQPYLARVETRGEISAIFFDGKISHTVRKVPVPGDYRVQDDFGADDFPIQFTEAQQQLAHRVVAGAHTVLGIPQDKPLLYARVDLLEDDDGELVVTELELVEPSLFFRHAPEAARRLTDALCRRMGWEQS